MGRMYSNQQNYYAGLSAILRIDGQKNFEVEICGINLEVPKLKAISILAIRTSSRLRRLTGGEYEFTTTSSVQVSRRVLNTVNFRADGIQRIRDLQVYVPQGVCGVNGDRLGGRRNVDLGGEHAVNAVSRYLLEVDAGRVKAVADLDGCTALIVGINADIRW